MLLNKLINSSRPSPSVVFRERKPEKQKTLKGKLITHNLFSKLANFDAKQEKHDAKV